MPEEISCAVDLVVRDEDVSVCNLSPESPYIIRPVSLHNNPWLIERELWIVPDSYIDAGPDLASSLGLVQLLFSEFSDGALRMGAVSIKVLEPEYPKIPTCERSYKEIRKRIKKSFRSGVWATNVVHGGSAFYKDLFISCEADSFVRSGGQLVSQFGDGNVVYSVEPLNVDERSPP
jgi:hypothetical protein